MNILNVGCGTETYGTHFIDLYPQRVGVIGCDVEKEAFPFPDDYFDEVYSANLLEHLKNPNQVLREMFRVLKKKGRLTVITDNASFWAYHLGARTHYGGYEKRSGDAEDRHYALYTSWHLQNHFRALGLKEIKAEYLWVKEKHSKQPLVRAVSRLLTLIAPHLGYPQIRITGVKE